MATETLYIVEYAVFAQFGGGVATYLPERTREAAERLVQEINTSEPLRNARIVTHEVEVKPYQGLGTCYKCGTPKVSDLFKGVYCPKCNDWI
jgi:hypothetical protein